MTIYLVRHGKDDDNYRGGWSKLGLVEEGRENNNGVLAGMLNTEAIEKYPNLFFNKLQMNERYPNGESPIEFYCRIKNAYRKLCDDMLNGEIGPNVMLVTHGGVINIIYYIINGLKWTNKSSKLCDLSNTGIHTIEYISGDWKITDSNNIEHLSNLVN